MISRITRTFVLLVLGVIWVLPVYLFVVNASKLPQDYNPNEAWVASGMSLFSNIADAWQVSGLGQNVLSSVLYSVVSAIIAVLVGAMVGFSIAALRLRHGFWWFVFIFGASVFPLQMVVLPLFDAYAKVGLFDTQPGMILAYTGVTVPFAAFVMRNFFSGVSYNVFEAAVVDGASTWGIFRRIYLPMASSALAAVFILQATSIWNDLLLGLTLSQSSHVRPIIPALASLQGAYSSAQVPTALAAAILVALPTLILFFASQRFFSRGLALGQY